MLQYPFSSIDIFVIADTESKYRFGLVSVAMKPGSLRMMHTIFIQKVKKKHLGLGYTIELSLFP